ncbi:MAG: hypothetical protein ACWA40_09760 [Planktomarina sp.]
MLIDVAYTLFIAFLGGIFGGMTRYLFAYLGRRNEAKVKSWDVLGVAIVDQFENLREISVEYWTSEQSEESRRLEAQIVAICDTLPDYYIAAFQEGPEIVGQLNGLMNELTECITGGAFQQANRPIDYEIVSGIEWNISKIKSLVAIENAQRPYPIFR